MLRLNPFELHEPKTVSEASALLKQSPGAMLVAGGTDLVPKIKRRQFDPEHLVCIDKIEGLRSVESDGDSLVIGALVTLAELEQLDAVRSLTALHAAISSVATPIIRASGTIAGNLMQDTRCRYYDRGYFWRDAVDFCLKKDGDGCRAAPGGGKCFAALCSDVAPALIVLGADVTLEGNGSRTIPLAELYRADGMNHLDTDGEILTRVRVPIDGVASSYRKSRARDSFDFPEAGVAVAVRPAGDRFAVRVAVTAIGPDIYHTEETIAPSEAEALADRVYAAIKPVDILSYPPAYRKAVVRNFLVRSLHELLTDR